MKNYLHSILIGLCLLCAGASNGVMDTLHFHYGSSVFAELPAEKQQYWHPDLSWKNKYKDWDGGDKSAAFPLSVTALVFLTDGWHFFQFLMLSLFSVAIVIALCFPFRWREIKTENHGIKLLFAVLMFAATKILFSVGFHLTYSIILPT